MMTSYRFGSSMRMPPMETNSARTSRKFIELILSTTAGGNVFSIPNKIPILFTPHPLMIPALNEPRPSLNVIRSGAGTKRSAVPAQSKHPTLLNSLHCQVAFSGTARTTNDHRLVKILSRHPSPKGPVVLAVVVPYVEPVGNSLG